MTKNISAKARQDHLWDLRVKGIDLYCMKHKIVLTYTDIDDRRCYQDKEFKSTYCLNLRGHGDEDEFSKRK